MNKADINHAENILRALSKATFNDMRGQEIFALADAFNWMAQFIKQSKEEPQKEQKAKSK